MRMDLSVRCQVACAHDFPRQDIAIGKLDERPIQHRLDGHVAYDANRVVRIEQRLVLECRVLVRIVQIADFAAGQLCTVAEHRPIAVVAVGRDDGHCQKEKQPRGSFSREPAGSVFRAYRHQIPRGCLDFFLTCPDEVA